MLRPPIDLMLATTVEQLPEPTACSAGSGTSRSGAGGFTERVKCGIGCRAWLIECRTARLLELRLQAGSRRSPSSGLPLGALLPVVVGLRLGCQCNDVERGQSEVDLLPTRQRH
jgi:hypothetical protein